MAGFGMASPKLMHRGGQYEAADELEEMLLRTYATFQSQLTPPYHLSTLSTAQHAQLTQALLCGILLNASAASSHITHLTAITTDGYASFVSILMRLVNESYPKLLEQSRSQILWLLKQLINLSAADVENLCLSLLRQVAGGDLSSGNVWLAAELLQIMKSSWTWVSGSPPLFTTALYTYLRLLPDHTMAKGPNLNDLKQNETAFCVQILRERFQDCLMIGRDLVRLLQDVAFIPEFESIWRDLLSNPAAFKAPAFADIAQLYVVRTPPRYLISRVTPEMENQIRFMLTHVRMGSQRRYQTWFAQRFLSSPESETLVCDLIRFICCVHHPSNQILQSDIVTRWAVVGWLLKCCKSSHVEANAKLALFYDWLFFMSKTDNIMNIEPGILLMVHSIPKYVDMTHSLLEFLFLLIEHYDPVRKDLIQKGVTSSVDILVGKGVVRSLHALTDSGLVASWLRDKLHFYFAAHCKSESGEGFKQMRPEHFQLETSYDHIQQQTGGSVMKGMFALGSATSPGREHSGGGVNSDSGQSLDLVTGPSMEDSKPGDSDGMNRKRRRLNAAESLQLEIQQNFERLAESLSRSQEAAVSVLEKLLGLVMSAPDQMFVDKLCKDNDSIKSSPSGTVNSSGDSASLTLTKLASQITAMIKKGGYGLFGPLQTLPSDRPEGDETLSLTAAVLRFYVANCRSRPLLHQLLLCWDREGLAVGARLLCHVSRLAEDMEPMSSRGLRARSISASAPGGVQDSETAVNSKNEEDYYDPSMNGDGDEEGEFTERSGESGRDHRRNGLTGVVGKAHGSGNSVALTRKGNRSRELQTGGDTHAKIRGTVSDAFKIYEEFLNLVCKGQVTVHGDNNGSHQNQGLHNSKIEGLLKTETSDLEAENVDVELLSDLETCLVWNTKRFLRILPSVFRYLPNLSVGKDKIFQLLVSSMDPQDLSTFEFRLLLGEFSIVGDQQEVLTRFIKNSLKWEFIEQQIFWRLLVAELQAAPLSVVMQVLKICSTVLNPQVNSEGMSGLLLLLRYHAPTSQLVNIMLFLPPAFGRFAAVVLASWMSSHHSQLLTSLQNLNSGSLKERQRKGVEDGEDTNNGVRRFSSSAVVVLLNSMDDAEFVRNNAEEKNMRVTRAAELRRALLKLAGVHGFVGLNSIQGPSEIAAENHQDRKLPS